MLASIRRSTDALLARFRDWLDQLGPDEHRDIDGGLYSTQADADAWTAAKMRSGTAEAPNDNNSTNWTK